VLNEGEDRAHHDIVAVKRNSEWGCGDLTNEEAAVFFKFLQKGLRELMQVLAVEHVRIDSRDLLDEKRGTARVDAVLPCPRRLHEGRVNDKLLASPSMSAETSGVEVTVSVVCRKESRELDGEWLRSESRLGVVEVGEEPVVERVEEKA
jgi:hypothetical protein